MSTPSNTPLFITYHAFILSVYKERSEGAVVKAIYQRDGGFKAFKRNYVKCYGFSEYLLRITGITLTAMQVYHVAKIFVVYGRRAPSTLPMVLAAIARQYDIEYPAVSGILSKPYWQSRFDDVLTS
jgi:hypothetical protein